MISLSRIVKYYQTGTDLSKSKTIIKDEIGKVYYISPGRFPYAVKASKTVQKCADFPSRPKSKKRIRWNRETEYRI